MLARTHNNTLCLRRVAHRICHVRFSSTRLPSDTFEPSAVDTGEDPLPSTHPNEGILNLLRSTIVAAEDDLNGGEGLNRYRITSFKRALLAVENTRTPIKSLNDAYKIQGIGEGIARRIGLYLSGQQDPTLTEDGIMDVKIKDTALAAFSAIPGIGRVKSRKLIDSGCLTLQELQSPVYKTKLTQIQQLGLAYREHLQKPVTRAEAETVANFIRDQLPPAFEIHIVGNYRRNLQSSPTLEILLLHPSHDLSSLPASVCPYPSQPPPAPTTSSTTSSPTGKTRAAAGRKPIFFRDTSFVRKADLSGSFLNRRVLEVLERSGLLVQSTKKGVVKWQGVAQVPRRSAEPTGAVGADGTGNGKEGKMAWAKMSKGSEVDSEDARYVHLEINMAPIESRATALLALTGDTDFVKDLKCRARRMGLEVNEWGLWKPLHSSSVNVDSLDSSISSTTTTIAAAIDGPRQRGRPKGSAKDRVQREEKQVGEVWERVQVGTEEEVLSELGMGWVEPTRRNFGLLASATTGGVRLG